MLEFARRRVGVRRGASAVAFATSWAVAEQSLGHVLGAGQTTAAIVEYREYWKEADRTTWRNLERFREAFPGEDTPARLLHLLADARDAKRQDTRTAGIAGAMIVA